VKRILPPVLFFIFAISMGLVCWGVGFDHYIQFPYNLSGLPLLIVGLAIAQFNKKMFLKTDVNINTFDKPNKLITTGFYKLSRNPMYLGFAIALLGISLLYQLSISSLIF
jgi:protein-S-isoprenylcysteine O-methyltransferase Ste14